MRALPCAVALATVVLSGGCSNLEGHPYQTTGQDIQVSLFHTTDWHSRVLPYAILDVGENDQNQGLLPENSPFGGAARLATLLKCARLKNITDKTAVPRECCCLEPSKCTVLDADNNEQPFN